MPIVAEMTVGWVLGFIASGIGAGGCGTALMAFYFRARDLRRIANSADLKAAREATVADETIKREARAENARLDSEALMLVINDLRTDADNQRKLMTTLQNETLQKIIAAHDEHHSCEKKYSALEARHFDLEAKFVSEKHRFDDLERKFKSLEGGK